MEDRSFFNSRALRILTFTLLFVLGFAIRLYDLTDLPLDFHPTRQLLSALKARGMYWNALSNVSTEQKTFAIQQWKIRAAIEPEVLETLVAFTYRFTGEKLWVARIYSSLFWMIGAIFLFLLSRKIAATDGALVTLAVYLFLPYAVSASRSFQPDPLMTMFIIMFWWAVYQWAEETTSYQFAILAGLFGGLAIYIKLVAAFFVIAGGLGALLGRMTLHEALKQPSAYVMSVLGILPAAAYTIYGVFIAGYLGQQFGGRFIPALFLNPSYYLGWFGMLNNVLGGFVLTLALLAFFFWDEKNKRFILALWLGYWTFGLVFNYHISSHDYYSLPLIPIAALTLAPLGSWFFAQLEKLAAPRPLIYAFLLLGLGAQAWSLRSAMKAVDDRPQAQMWQEIGSLTQGANLIGLTQDYGASLAYWGWSASSAWPTFGDLNYHQGLRGAPDDFENQFAEMTSKKALFIVTDFAEFKRQPLLENELARYPVFAQGDGYLIYNLKP
ncbi:MAG: glycosyltransferase family 39 protein [Anaerolineales bacterium]|nr:glycosyltransferase family 39 protein [Anaerolineales bacterium]